MHRRERDPLALRMRIRAQGRHHDRHTRGPAWGQVLLERHARDHGSGIRARQLRDKLVLSYLVLYLRKAPMPPKHVKNWLPSTVSVEIISTSMSFCLARSVSSSMRSSLVWSLAWPLHFGHAMVSSGLSRKTFFASSPHEGHLYVPVTWVRPSESRIFSACRDAIASRTCFSPYIASPSLTTLFMKRSTRIFSLTASCSARMFSL